MSSLIFFLILIVIIVAMMVRIVPEYERAVIFRLGRVQAAAKGPGLFFIIPIVDQMYKISIRTVTMDIEPQDVISKDNVSLKVNAVLYFRVVNPIKAMINIENYQFATNQLAQTHLRSVLGENTLDELLSERDRINSKLQTILDENTDPWGIKVVAVELKHIDLPPDMQRAMAKEAEAERQRRAKIIAAEGEAQAALKLKAAADTMSSNEQTLQLRYLQTMVDIAGKNNTTSFFPIPIELFKGLSKIKNNSDA
ncbi:MAG: slipin family protein [Bdellovibrionota bacterium]